LRDYHFINPFKGYYIATTAGSIYRNWLKAEIYDSNFNLISKDEFNSPFIYKDKLILKNKKYELVEYDITKKKVMRTIGKTSSSYDDYLFYNGYLFLGSANFEDDELEAC